MFTSKAIVATILMLSSGVFNPTEDLLISESTFEPNPIVHLEGWEENFLKAKEKAKEENRPILMAFLGPKWCARSDQFELKVLSTQYFLEELKSDVVFFKTDLAEAPLQVHAQEAPAVKLRERYHIEQCPSLVLLTPKGEMLAELECLSLEKEAVVQQIKQTILDFTELQKIKNSKEVTKLSIEALQACYAKAIQFTDTNMKDFFFEKGLKKDKGPYFLLEKYGRQLAKGGYHDRSSKRIRNKIIARDPQNISGAQRKLALIDFEALANFKRPLKVKAVIKPLTDYLKKFGDNDPENSWKIEMKISQYLFGHNQLQGSLEHAKHSLEIAPETAVGEIQSAIDFLKGQIAKEKGKNSFAECMQ